MEDFAWIATKIGNLIGGSDRGQNKGEGDHNKLKEKLESGPILKSEPDERPKSKNPCSEMKKELDKQKENEKHEWERKIMQFLSQIAFKNQSNRLEIFTGEEDVEEWLNNLDLHARLYKWNEEEVICHLYLKLDGPAKEWFKDLPIEDLNSLDKIMESMRMNFGRVGLNYEDIRHLSH